MARRLRISLCRGLYGLALVAIAAAGVMAAEAVPAPADAPVTLPATGQTESYPADTADGLSDPVPVPDDGRVRAGAPLRYRDNGDGTVTDLNTRLVWEKKCSDCESLHDVGNRYGWSGDGEAETIWDWLASVNAEDGEGFAGHSDWRIPNVTELLSIIDYGQWEPAVSDAFDGAAYEDGCTDLAQASCSCTEAGEYWSSTTFGDFPAHAYVVSFAMGLINDRVKTNPLFVRAVRGGR